MLLPLVRRDEHVPGLHVAVNEAAAVRRVQRGADRPPQRDRALGRERTGADASFGHHAHRLQPMDVYRGRPIFYGLGNFVWPNFSVEGSTTAVAEVSVDHDGRIRGRLLPAFIESAGHPVLR